MACAPLRSRSLFAAVVFLSTLAVVPLSSAQIYHRTNLVSDIPGVALRTDPNLVNPWGIAFSPTSPVWIADNGTGVSALYLGDGTLFPTAKPLVVTIPPPAGGTNPAAPTGIVFNGAGAFVVSANGKSGSSAFIFSTEDGTISGWSPAVDVTHAIGAVDNSSPGGVDGSKLGAVYKGLATGATASGNFLYATNFRDGWVEMYDSTFHFVKSFTDPNLPMDFAPFGIQNINGHLYVTFAMQNAQKHDDVAGPGNGFVDVFDTEGNMIKRFASQGSLNSPWGLALAPRRFGKFSGALLVGDFGDGRINAFDAASGMYLGQLLDTLGTPLAIDSLWGLHFGNGSQAGDDEDLLFTAGIGGEQHGLFGVIRAVHRDHDHDGDKD